MLRKVQTTLVSVVTILALSGCGSECTEESLKEKLQDISVKVQDLAASGDVSKLMELSMKASKISQTMQGGGENLQAACDAADELLDEL